MAGSRPTRASLQDRRFGLAAICVFVVALGLWNVAHYPTGLGFDAGDHQAYADGLVPGGHFPQGTGEYYTPPGYYAVAGSLDWVTKKIGYGDPDRAGQLVNVLFLLGTVLLVARIARELWPGRARIELGAAAFVALLPVTVEAEAMFHPETMSLFFSTLALWLCVRTFSDARYAWALGVALGAVQLVRAFALTTVAAAAIALFIGRRWQQLAIVVVLAVLIPSPWYVHQRLKYGGQPEFPRPAAAKPHFGVGFFVDPGLPDVITKPYRPRASTPALSIDALPTAYDGLWGDYWGAWVWKAGEPIDGPQAQVTKPSASARHELVIQALVGLLPTLIALIGWAALARSSLRSPSRLAVALLPLLSLIGYFYFAVQYWVDDGDLLKTTYMLTATSGWAIGFGYALDRLRGRAWQVTVVLLAVCAVVELPFLVY